MRSDESLQSYFDCVTEDAVSMPITGFRHACLRVFSIVFRYL